MRIDPTVALALTLFTLMIGATSASAFWGYALGRRALSGVTQPETRPRQNGVAQAGADQQEDFVLKSEADIIAAAKARISGQPLAASPEQPQAKSLETGEETDGASLVANREPEDDLSFINYQTGFPLLVESQNVILAVNSVRRQGEDMQVDVTLQNTGGQTVEFLYSLMDVVDDRGRSLSASTDGLPQSLPPTGQTYEGSITIPVVLLERANSFSLRLADYPEQQVELSISGIPVAR